MQANVLPLPTMNKINNETLMLVGYKLNKGVCHALRNGLEKYNQRVSKVILENNGISDEILSELLDTFTLKAHEITSLALGRNEFGPKASQSLSNLLEQAYNMSELKIENCKIIGTAMEDFIDKLKDG